MADQGNLQKKDSNQGENQIKPVLRIHVRDVITLASISLGLLFFLFILALIWPYVLREPSETTLLRELSETGVARGLITFLIALSTVSIALILTVCAVANLTTDDTKSANWEANFTKAKELLSILIGVLGTIVGFYFGQSTAETPVTILRIENAKLAPPTVSLRDSLFTISTEITGGKAPYEYTISFKPDSLSALTRQTSNLSIVEKVPVPKTIPTDSTIKIVIKARDKENRTAESDTLRLRVKP